MKVLGINGCAKKDSHTTGLMKYIFEEFKIRKE